MGPLWHPGDTWRPPTRHVEMQKNRYTGYMKVQKKSHTEAVQPHRPEIFILLAHGFDAQLVTEIATHGRLAAQPVTLIGLTMGPLRSDLGISLNPDRTMEQLPPLHAPIVLFPGGKASTMALLRDPRVHRLCKGTWKKGGQVVASPDVSSLLHESGIRVADVDIHTPGDWWRELLYAAI